MPLPKGSKVLGQKRIKDKMILTYKTKEGEIKSEIRTSLKCPKNPNKPCKEKKKK
jgi:hypothetical protein